MGPSALLLAAPTTAQAPAAAQIDSELLSVPSRSNRKAALAGLALATAVALAAWWTVRDPSETHQAEGGLAPTEVEAEAVPERTEPVALPEEPVPVEPIEEISAEPETQAVEPPPPKARRENASKRRRSPSPPESSQYQKPPDLVTEW